MFNKTLLLGFLLISSSNAEMLDEIVNKAYSNNYDLISIEKSIQLSDENIKLAKKWQNPVLSLGINDIWFNDVFSRDNEPMQTQYIGISQVIPVGNKLQIKEDIQKKDKQINKYIFEDKKLQLKANIYELSLNILILEKKYTLLNNYQNNLSKLQKLYMGLYKYGKATQNEILNTKIANSNINLQKQNIKNNIDNLYLKLEEITYEKIDSINSEIVMEKIALEKSFTNHPKLKILNEKNKKFNKISALELEKERSDIKVNVAYFNRDEKYNDYANISVNIPLSVYKTEKVKALKAKIEAKRALVDIERLKQNFKTKVNILENNMNNSRQNYELIKKSIIPLKRKIQKNLENYNSFDMVKPDVSIKNLNELISYEIKALNEKQKYYTNISKSIYYVQRLSK